MTPPVPLPTQQPSDLQRQSPHFSRVINACVQGVPFRNEAPIFLTSDAIAKTDAGTARFFDHGLDAQEILETSWRPVTAERLTHGKVYPLSLECLVRPSKGAEDSYLSMVSTS
jgi:hypothetical protein